MAVRQSQPFTAGDEANAVPEIAIPQPDFAVDPIDTGGPYVKTAFNTWAPTLAEVIDPNRVMGRTQVDIDTAVRPTALTYGEDTDADGWQSIVTRREYGPDPRWSPSKDFRPTGLMSPSRWRYFRPFGQRFATIFDGTHFSFAAYRRNYDIAGMRPATPNRNTQRIEPKPWDHDIVDGPSAVNADLPYSHNPGYSDILPGRSYRAG